MTTGRPSKSRSLDRDVAGLEPALDERGGGAQRLGLRRVVAASGARRGPARPPGQDRASADRTRRSCVRDMFGAMAAHRALRRDGLHRGADRPRARGARRAPGARRARRASRLDGARGRARRARGARRPTSATRRRCRALVGAGDVLVAPSGRSCAWARPPSRPRSPRGAHYLDSTGEGPFIREVFERHGPRRAARPAAGSLTAMGFDCVPGNVAGALALREAGERRHGGRGRLLRLHGVGARAAARGPARPP